jgi:hypothetical protein
MKIVLACIALFTATAAPVQAVDRSFEVRLEKSLKNSVPDSWWLRASWREKTLVVFVSPPPAEAFKLWYHEQEQLEVLQQLCREIGAGIWSAMAADQDIAMEPVVGGNGGKGSWRLSCRSAAASPNAGIELPGTR